MTYKTQQISVLFPTQVVSLGAINAVEDALIEAGVIHFHLAVEGDSIVATLFEKRDSKTEFLMSLEQKLILTGLTYEVVV